MDLGRIKILRELLDGEAIDTAQIAEIQEAFDRLVASGAELRDLPENALAADQLDELEEHVTTAERTIYEWVSKVYGENEANEPSWSTFELAKVVNAIPVVGDSATLGDVLNEKQY